MRQMFAVVILLLSAADVAAQPMCAPRDHLLRRLSQEYGEAPVSSGVMGNGGLIEVLTAPSGTWTILVTRPGGVSCLIASGEGWQDAMPTVPGRDS